MKMNDFLMQAAALALIIALGVVGVIATPVHKINDATRKKMIKSQYGGIPLERYQNIRTRSSTVNDQKKQTASSQNNKNIEKEVQSKPQEKNVSFPVEEENPCPICMDEMNDNDNNILKLPCRHCFHEHCIQDWLKKSNTCPYCRAEVPGFIKPAPTQSEGKK